MNTIEELDFEDEAAKKFQIMRDNCIKLMDSQPFKDVIDKGYFLDEAARLCMAKSSDLSELQMKNIDNMIMGVGGLANYLNMLVQRGNQADQRIADNEITREEVLEEEREVSNVN